MLEVPNRARFDRRVERNDQRSLDAAAALLAEAGWGGLSLLAIAKRAGLSKRATTDRFLDREGVGIGLWQARMGAVAVAALEHAVNAAGLDGKGGSRQAFADALRTFGAPDVELRCVAELLTVAHVRPRLREVVDADFGATLRRLCTPSDTVTPTRATQRSVAVALGFGTLLTAGRWDGEGVDPERYLDAWLHPTAPTDLPTVPGFTLQQPFDFGTDDPRYEALLNAALEVVSAVGFDGATTMALVQHAGYSEGTLFARYPSKTALFLDAITRLQARTVPELASLTASVAERFGPGIAQAVTIRTSLSAERWRGRHLALEYERLAATNPEVHRHARDEARRMIEAVDQPPGVHPRHRIEEGVRLALAFGVGIALLPAFLPGVEALPFDVVMVPLAGG